MKYSPIASSLLAEADAHQLFQNVAEHCLAQAGGDHGRVASLPHLPPEAKAIWQLWCFLAEVAGNGAWDYLCNHCSSLVELQEVHAALQLIGADEMRELLEYGIQRANEQGCGEFLEQSAAKAWAGRFASTLSMNDEELNTASMEAAHPGGSEIAANFIRNNTGVL